MLPLDVCSLLFEGTKKSSYGELTLFSLDVSQVFNFFLQIGLTLIFATLEDLDLGLLGDVISEDDCGDDGEDENVFIIGERKMENLNEVRVKELRSDNGIEFRNHKLEEFCDEKGISQNFSSPCTPEQYGVVERRNKTLIEAAITIGRSPDISCFHVFGCPVHIHNHRDHLRKFDEKADDGFFLGYSLVAKAFRVFNIRRQEMEETVHVTFSKNDETISQTSTEVDALNFNENRSFPDDEFLIPRKSVISEDPLEFTKADNHPALNEPNQAESANLLESAEPQNNVIIKPVSDVQPSPTISPSAEVILQTLVPQDRWSREKHIELVYIIGEPLASITTRSRIRDSDVASASECLYVNFLSEMEPKKLIEALEEEG
ncbi:retrovirus-related pol polyprotein from transposon TNT 1-94 [Tanacetum coccineum]